MDPSMVAGAARVMPEMTSNCLRDPDSGFFLRVYSRSLSHNGQTARQRRFEFGVFLLLDGPPTKAVGPIDPA